jgi:diguanylate cyclase (GGDEF)-like protein
MLDQINMIRQLSMADQLTGIPNRRSFDYQLRLEWNRAKRDKTSLSVFLIDIDKFKIYNDTYGHLQGDKALQAVAKVTERSLKRSTDFLARWGGEEFVVLLPSIDVPGASIVAEHIRKNIEDVPSPCTDGAITKITVSIGINTLMNVQESSVHDFIDGADQALYTAKKTGRNRVCIYEGITEPQP